MFPSYEQPDIGKVRVTNTPIRFHNTQEVPLTPAPELGGQTRDVLHRLLNISQQDLDTLEKNGIIYNHQ